jgi:hypothetical protein
MVEYDIGSAIDAETGGALALDRGADSLAATGCRGTAGCRDVAADERAATGTWRVLFVENLPFFRFDLEGMHQLHSMRESKSQPGLLSPGMRLVIGTPDVLRGQVSIDLRGRDIGMTE